MAPLYPSFTPTYHHDQYPAIDPTQFDCSDKIIVITGAGRGIGAATAIAFAQAHAKGIALLGRTQSTLEDTKTQIKSTSNTTDVFVTTADITSKQQIQTAFDAIVSHYGTVPDILVNNAGGLDRSSMGALVDVDVDDFWKAIELNTKGPLTVSMAFLRANRAHTPNAPRMLVNIPSGAAHVPYMPGGGAYAVAKLASARITEYVHYENPDWLVVNLQPGVVDTELARSAGRKAPDSPRLAAGTTVWLAASPEARNLNGLFLWANWDVNELLERKEELQRRGLLRLGLKGWAEDSGVEDLIGRARSVHQDAKK